MKLEVFGEYWRKWRGTTAGSPPRVHSDEVFWSWIGAVLGIGLLGWIGQQFFAPRSPLAQPRNLIGGHLISALIGVLCWQLFAAWPVLAQALAVATAIAAMHLTRTLHPPGGATALIATLGSPDIQALGFWYALMPATLGPLVLLLVGLAVNNLPKTRRYPEVWF